MGVFSGCFDKIVLYNPSSEKIADLYYHFISVPIHYSYIDGGINESRYDLEKLLLFLRQDKQVINGDSLVISDIPYYNQEEEETTTIDFYYLLPDSVYGELMEKRMDSFTLKSYILDQVIGAKRFKKEEMR